MKHLHFLEDHHQIILIRKTKFRKSSWALGSTPVPLAARLACRAQGPGCGWCGRSVKPLCSVRQERSGWTVGAQHVPLWWQARASLSLLDYKYLLPVLWSYRWQGTPNRVSPFAHAGQGAGWKEAVSLGLNSPLHWGDVQPLLLYGALSASPCCFPRN